MAYRTFTGCWAKLAHANHHIGLVKAEIEQAGAPDPEMVEVSRVYEPTDRAVVYRIERVIQIGEDWPLIVGDAVHDLRSALDHLMWQLAIKHLGRTPTKSEAPNIQFPEIRKLGDFHRSRFLRYVSPSDIDRLKAFQPYRRLKKGQLHPLPKLVKLSNIDKHRKIHLLVSIPQSSSFTNNPDAFRDCLIDDRLMPNGAYANIEFIAPRRNPRVNDAVLRVFVQPTGPNPDVDLDYRLQAFVGIGRLGPVVPMLEGMAGYVKAVLSEFDGS